MCKEQEPSDNYQISQEFSKKKKSNSVVTHAHLIYSEIHAGYRNLSQPKYFTSIKSKVRERADQEGMDVKE